MQMPTEISWPCMLGLYLLIINVITLFAYGVDKWKARRSHWRIPESRLLWMAALGGSLGAMLGMRLWHHKTLHAKFRYGVPAILFGQLLLAAGIAYLLLSR